MTARFFGQYLIESGEIDAAMLRDALGLMDRQNKSLGELGVERGYLSEAEASRVNVQQRIRDVTFGTLAVEMRLLGADQLEELLRVQRESRIQIGQALVKLGHLTEDALEEQLGGFKRDQEPYEDRVTGVPDELADFGLVVHILDLLPRACLRVARVRAKLSAGESLDDLSHHPYRVSVMVRGAHTLEITLCADRELAARLASGTSGLPAARLDRDLIADGLGEFLNVLAGGAISIFEHDGEVTSLDPLRLDAHPSDGTVFPIVSPEGSGALVLRSA